MGPQRTEQRREGLALAAAECRDVAVAQHLGGARLGTQDVGVVGALGRWALGGAEPRLGHEVGQRGAVLGAGALAAEPRRVHEVVPLEVQAGDPHSVARPAKYTAGWSSSPTAATASR